MSASEEIPVPGSGSGFLRRAVRSLGRFAWRLLVGGLLLIVTIGILLQVPPVSSFVARTALSLANPWPGTTSAIGAAGGSWFSSLKLTDVIIAGSSDSLTISIDTLRVSYDLTALTGGTLHLRDVYLSRPIVRTRFLQNGSTVFLQPFAPDTADRDTSGGLRIRADHLHLVNGEFALMSPPDTQQVEFLDVRLRADSILIADGIATVIDTVSLRMRRVGRPEDDIRLVVGGTLSAAAFSVRSLSLVSARSRVEAIGEIPLPFSLAHSLPGMKLHLSASPVSYHDLHLLFPGVGPEGEARLELVTTGQGDSSTNTLLAEFPAGGTITAEAKLIGLPGGRIATEITGASTRFSPSSFSGMPDSSASINTRFSLSGTGTSTRDVHGALDLEVLPSIIGGTGPLTGKIHATIDSGYVHAKLRAGVRSVLLAAEAALTPFEPTPSYELTGSLTVPRSEEVDTPLERLGGLTAQLSIAGRGIVTDSVHARATLRGTWGGNPHFKAVLFEVDAESDTVRATGNLLTASGSFTAKAEAILGETPIYKIHVPSFQRISLAAFGEGLPQSSLTGSLRAEVSGSSLADLDGGLTLALDSSHIGHVVVESGQTEIAIDRGRIRFAGVGRTNAGSVSLQGLLNPSPDSPQFTLEEMDFRGVDLGMILGSKDMSSDLSGTVQLRGSARTMHDVTRLIEGNLRGEPGLVRASGTVRLSDSRFRRQSIPSAMVTMTLLDGDLQSSIQMQSSAGDLNGAIHVRPFGENLDVSVRTLKLEHLDVGALIGEDSLRTDLTGSLEGTFRGDSLEGGTGDLSVTFENPLVDGVLPIKGSLQAAMEGGRFSLNSTASFIDGDATLEAGGRFTRGTLEGKLSLSVAFREGDLQGNAAVGPSPGLSMSGSIEGSWGASEATDLRGMFFGGGSHGKLKADTLLCDFSIRGRVVDVDTLRILTNVASVTAGGSLTLFDSTATSPSDFNLSATVTSLQPLEGVFGLDPELLQSATLALNASGLPETTRVRCVTNVNMVSTGEFALASLHGSVDMRLGPSAALQSIDGSVEMGGLHYGPLVVANAFGSLHSIRNAYDIVCRMELERGSTISMVGLVRNDSDSLTVLIDSLVARSPNNTWSLARQASIIYGQRLVVRDFTLHSGSRDIVVKGVLDPNGEQDFTISSDSLNVGNVGELFGRPGLDGLLFTDIHVGGPAGNPRAVGDLSVILRNAGADLGRLSAQLDWGSRSLNIVGEIRQPAGGKLDATALLPVGLSFRDEGEDEHSDAPDSSGTGPLEIKITADKLDLSLFKPILASQSVSSLAGTLTADIRAAGSLASVDVNGSASIVDGQIGIPQLGTVFSGIQIRSTASGKDLHIEEARATSGEGILQLSGLISLSNPKKPTLDIKMSLDRFVPVQTPDMKISASGELLVTGEAATPHVSGGLAINDSYFVLPDAARDDSVESVVLTAEDYAMLQRHFGYTRLAATVEKGRSAIEPVLDMTVNIQKNTWVRKRRNPTLAIELVGSVQIERRPERPLRVNGTMRCPPGRSYVGQFGRQFELTEGEIILKGPLEETELHIYSEYRVPSKGGSGLSEVVIRMKAETVLGRFVFSLTSDPPMDESEILSYLATGQSRTGALANTGDQGGLAGAMALEQLVGVAGGLAEGSMPLDVFQIRQDGARGITVVAGNYVSPKTYLGIRQPILLNQGTEDSYYDTRTQYELEYEARPWLFLNLQGGSSRTMLFLKARMAY